MHIVQTSITKNTSGYVDRLERGAIRKLYNIQYEHVKDSVPIQQPKIDDFNSLVVIHDKVEEYI